MAVKTEVLVMKVMLKIVLNCCTDYIGDDFEISFELRIKHILITIWHMYFCLEFVCDCMIACHWSQEVHNKIREQFRNMPDEFMTSTIAGTSKVR